MNKTSNTMKRHIFFNTAARSAAVIAMVFSLTACARFKGEQTPTKFSHVAGIMQSPEAQDVVLSRADYRAAVANEQLLSNIRLVPVLKSQYASSSLPEYRIFGIRDGSPYALIGLRNADIIIAANDYIIYQSTDFPRFLTLLQNEPSGTVMVRRGGGARLLKISFTE